jgi:tetratricopeptide (TPR) repeat protein
VPENQASSSSRRLTFFLLAAAIVVGAVAAYVLLSPTPGEPKSVDGRDHPVVLSETELLLARARKMIAVGRKDDAVRAMQDYVRLHPDDVEIRSALTEVFLGAGKFDEADEILDEILQRRPDHPTSLWRKGQLIVARARRQAEDRERAAAADDRTALRAKLLELIRAAERLAETFLRKAADQDDAGADIWSRYGLMLLNRGETARARNYLNRALRTGRIEEDLAPEQAGAVCLALGNMAFQENDVVRAETLLNRAAALVPGEPEPWQLLAELQRNLERRDAAADSLRRGLKLVPSGRQGALLLRLGKTLNREETKLEAAEAFARAADHAAVRREALPLAAECYYQLGQYALAMKYIDQAAELPGDAPAVAELKTKIEDARFGPARPATNGLNRSLLDALREQAPAPEAKGPEKE